jgi:hypothetical protein
MVILCFSRISAENFESNPFEGWDYVYLVIKKDNDKVSIITLKSVSRNNEGKKMDEIIKNSIRKEYFKKHNKAAIFSFVSLEGKPKSQTVPMSIEDAEALNLTLQSFINPERIDVP